MNSKFRNKKTGIIVGIMVITIFFLVFLRVQFQEKTEQQTGKIFLYGEEHAVERILEKEFELWTTYYHRDGIRDLFVELPYYTAEYMNLWMKSEEDDILEMLYQNWEGTAIHTQEVLNFYQRIKKECPETVFHGTDVGHQYDTIGKSFLEYLELNGQKDSEQYKLSEENIEQGKYYYQHQDNVYRENIMTENFIREMEGLDGRSIMGIYGSAHIGIEAMDYMTNTVPCMANQLNKKYGDILYTEDLIVSTLNSEAYRVDIVKIGEKEYRASYFGKVDLSAILPDYQYREFWRIEDAYEDFKENPTVNNVLPYHNYPMPVETGQVFIIEYTKVDGTVIREYHRADGNIWSTYTVTEEFQIEEK